MDIAVFRFEKPMLKLPFSRPKGAAWLNNSRENHKLNNRQLLATPLDRHLHILGIDCAAVHEILQRVGGGLAHGDPNRDLRPCNIKTIVLDQRPAKR